MTKFLKKLSGLTMAAALVLTNLIPAVAADSTSNSTAPTLLEVTTEAQETASYLLERADYSAITDTSSFYNASRDLFLAIRSGLDCTEKIAAYTNALNSNLDEDGKLTLTLAAYGYPNDIFGCQAYAINVLAAAGLNPSDFHGKNLVSGLSTLLEGTTSSDFTYGSDANYVNTGMNPYFLGVLYTTVETYANDITNSTTILTNIRAALTPLYVNNTNGTGIDYYGINIDSASFVLPGFSALYETDSTYKTMVDSSLDYLENQRVDAATGAALYYDSYSSSSFISTSSTALAPGIYGSFEKNEMAAISYNALQRFALTTAGAYPATVDGTNPDAYTTQMALFGLVSYQYALADIRNIFDVSQTIDFASLTAVEEPTTEAPTTDAGTETAPPTGDSQPVVLYAILASATLLVLCAKKKQA